MAKRPAPKLFTPGPVMMHPAVKKSLAHAEMPHRRGAFQALLRETTGRIRTLLNACAGDGVALLTGSGSAATPSPPRPSTTAAPASPRATERTRRPLNRALRTKVLSSVAQIGAR